MNWSEDAKKALDEVPFFVRKRVKKRVEAEAGRSGAFEVTMEHVQNCRQNFLTKMEEEVEGCRVETCFGPGGCPNRAVICEGLPEKINELPAAGNMKSFLKKTVPGGLKIHNEFRITISDCPNACSRPQISDIGLIGACRPAVSDELCSGCNACIEACEEGAISFLNDTPVINSEKCLACGKCAAACPTGSLMSGESGYRVLLGGKLGRHPRLGAEVPGIFGSSEILKTIDACLDYYTKHSTKGKRLGEIMEERGAEEITRRIIP